MFLLTNILIFDHFFAVYENFNFWLKLLPPIFDQNFDFSRNFSFLTELLISEENFNLVEILLINILIFD